MPEEKVSHATTVTQCPKFQWCVMGHSHEGQCSSTHYVLAPAADAGPRQPDTCKDCGKPKFGPWGTICTAEIGKVNEYYCQCVQVLVPPVPQEAAPDELAECGHFVYRQYSMAADDYGCSGCDAEMVSDKPATAPDEAMRVAEQKAFSIMWDEDCAQYRVNIPRYYGGKVVRLEDVAAALIRQAGSERERELERVLGEFMNKTPRTYYSWRKESEAELRPIFIVASRLLGGN